MLTEISSKTVVLKNGLVNMLLGDVLPFSLRMRINDVIYYSAIIAAIAVCFFLAYKKLPTIGYSKKQAAIYTLCAGLAALPLGLLSSKAANMFYLPPDQWGFKVFFEQTFSGGTHTFHACWVLPMVMNITMAKIMKIRNGENLDIIFLYMPVGHAIGRIACLLIGCCWGQQTSCMIHDTIYHFHVPIPLLAIINNLLLFLFLRFLFASIYYNRTPDRTPSFKPFTDRTRETFTGAVAGSYLVGYGLNRFLIEYIRTEKIIMAGLTQAQMAMIIYIIAGILFFGYMLYKFINRKTSETAKIIK